MVLTSIVAYSNNISGTRFAPAFCEGKSTTMKKIIAEHEGASAEELANGDKYKTTAMALIQLMILVELLIYLNLYCLQIKHNQRMVAQGVFPLEVQVQRQRKNVITMSSQAATFFIESIASVIFQVMLHQNVEYIDEASLPFAVIVIDALVTISHIWAAPELRRFYWNGFKLIAQH